MELSLIEKYFFDKFEQLEKENAELKDKIRKLESSSEASLERANIQCYQISTYSWHINKGNCQRYEQALKEKDLAWLFRNSYTISSYLIDYQTTLFGKTYYFKVTDSDNRLHFQQVTIDNQDVFDSLEKAQERLLETLKEDIEEIKAKIAKEEQSNADKPE